MRFTPFMCFATFFFVFLWHNFLIGQVEDDDNKLKENAAVCSIFESCVSNFTGLSCGDFLVRETISFDSVKVGSPVFDGAVADGEILTRHIFDSTTGQIGFYKWSRVSDDDFSSVNSASKQTMLRGFSTNSKDVFSRFFPEKVVKKKASKKSLADASSNLFFDIRGIGIAALPQPNGFIAAKNTAKLLSSGAKLTNKIESDSQLSLTVLLQVRQSGTKVFRDYTFDLETNMPVKMVERYKVVQNGEHVDSAGYTVSFKWKERDGIYIPSKIVFDGAAVKVINDKQEIGSIQRIFDFHWFSVNDSSMLDADYFSASPLNSMQQFLKLVDPKLSGAEALIEAEK